VQIAVMVIVTPVALVKPTANQPLMRGFERQKYMSIRATRRHPTTAIKTVGERGFEPL
jgi:hypothetical protein